MHRRIHFPGECVILPKWALFLLVLEGTHARLLGMGGPEVAVLKVVTAVSRLEDCLTPPSPSSFKVHCADWLLWRWKNKISLQSLKLFRLCTAIMSDSQFSRILPFTIRCYLIGVNTTGHAVSNASTGNCLQVDGREWTYRNLDTLAHQCGFLFVG